MGDRGGEEPGQFRGRWVGKTHHVHGFGVVAEVRRSALARPPPQTLPPRRNLDALEVPCNVSVEETKPIDDRRMDRKLRRRHIDGAYHLLHRLTVGGKCRGMLILAPHIKGHPPRPSPCRSPAHYV